MVMFDSRDPGTSAETWGKDGRLRGLPNLDIAGISELIVVAAHPDDETLGAGGLIAECSKRGIPVRVVVVTDGGASHPESPSILPVHLAVRRRLEVTEAMTLLAPGASLTFLDFDDGSIRENRAQVLVEVRCLVKHASASALLVAPWRGDGHRDHRILGEICAEAVGGTSVTMREYPIWMWHWSDPDSSATPWGDLSVLRLEGNSIDAKRLAVSMHRSQVTALSIAPGDEAVLHPAFLRNFDHGIEVFIG